MNNTDLPHTHLLSPDNERQHSPNHPFSPTHTHSNHQSLTTYRRYELWHGNNTFLCYGTLMLGTVPYRTVLLSLYCNVLLSLYCTVLYCMLGTVMYCYHCTCIVLYV